MARKAGQEEGDLLAVARGLYLKARAADDPTDWAFDEAYEKTKVRMARAWDQAGKYQTINRYGPGGVMVKAQIGDDYRYKRWRLMLEAQVSSWEAEVQQQRTQQTAEQQFEVEVAKLQFLADQAKKLLDRAIAQQANEPSTGNAQSYSICYKNWIDATERLRAYMASRVSETTWERQRPSFEQAREVAFKKMYKEYHGKGEAYRLLCLRAASAWATLERLEAAGVLPGQAEHSKVNAEFLALVSQIQKHTESIKTEVQETRLHEFGDKILKVVERHLQNQPLVMKRILADIEGDVIEGETRLLTAAS